MLKKIYVTILIFLIFLCCKKSRNSTSWNTYFSIPVSTDSVNLNKFINEDKLYLSNDGTHVLYKDTFELYRVDQSIIGDDIQIEFTDTIIVPSFLSGIPFPLGYQLPIQFSEINDEFYISDKSKDLINLAGSDPKRNNEALTLRV